MSKSFAAAASDLAEEPIQFNLGPDEEFEVARPLPGFPVADLASKAKLGGTEAISAFLNFFEKVMEPEEFERFEKEANRQRLDLEKLIEICGWVIEEGSGRPTQRPNTSAES